MVLLTGTPARAASYTLSTLNFSVPNEQYPDTYLNGINNSNVIVGAHDYYDQQFNFNDVGIMGQAASLAAQSVAGLTDNPNFYRFSFNGISNTGSFVGSYVDTSNNYVTDGFSVIGGALNTIAVAGASQTSPTGINTSGVIVGSYYNGGQHGFVDTGGKIATLDDTAANVTATWLYGINDIGQIVGQIQITDPNTQNTSYAGVIWDGSQFNTISVAGSTDVAAYGINNQGQIVGSYAPTGNSCQAGSEGFVLSGGVVTSIVAPLVAGNPCAQTSVIGINGSGTIVGYSSFNLDPDGFIGTLNSIAVPEPASFSLLGTALVGLCITRRRRR